MTHAAVYGLAWAIKTADGLTTSIMSFVLGLLSAAASLVSTFEAKGSSAAIFLAVWGCVLGGASLILDGIALKGDFPGTPEKTMDGVTFGMDVGSMAIGLNTVWGYL